MAEEPFERLAAHASQVVPSADPGFVDRLESDLRVEHARQTRPGLGRLGRWRVGWGFALAALVLTGGFVALTRLSAGEPGVPLEVTSENPAGQDFSDTDGPGAENSGASGAGDHSGVVTTVTPTPAPSPDEAGDGVTTSAPDDVATPAVLPPATPTSGPGDSAATPDPTATPTATVERPIAVAPTVPTTPTREPTAVPTRPPTAVVTPIAPPPTPKATATPPPDPTPRPTPGPTLTPAPVPLLLDCAFRTARDSMGVVCEWQAPTSVGFDRYVLMRSRNGSEAVAIATRRADAQRVVIDRDLSPSDTLIYLVRALQDDQVIGASQRVTVRVPTR